MKTLSALALLLQIAACGQRNTAAKKAVGAELVCDFERDVPGQVPVGWSMPKVSSDSGYIASTVRGEAHSGKQAVLLSGTADPDEFPVGRAVGMVMRTFDAAPYRGQRVRFRAAVKTQIDRVTTAALWLRMDSEVSGAVGSPSLQSEPIRTPVWKVFDVVGTVEPDAKTLTVGLLLDGAGLAWIDDVRVEIPGPSPKPEPPRPLAGRGLANLVAFTRLLGYIHFFHPSDQATNLDWDGLAIAGVRAVESADTPAETAKRLQSIFADVAPTLRVFETTSKEVPATPADLMPPPNASGLSIVMWQHHGYGFGADDSGADSRYSSERISEAWRSGSVALPFANPREPMVVNLGGGVAALMPLVLFRDAGGTLPHVHPVAEPNGGATDVDDRAVRLADVALAWTVLQHFYPYFDAVKVDWGSVLEQTLVAAAVDCDEAAFMRTIARMVSWLHDGHGNVYRAEAPVALVPIEWGVVERRLVVLAVGGAVAGIKRGDVILSIQGRPALDAIAAELPMVSAATPWFAQWKALQQLEVGEPGSTVEVEVQSPGQVGTIHRVVLTRTVRPEDWATERKPAPISELRPGLWYVDLERVQSTDLGSFMGRLVRAKAVIFDVRGYPTAAAMDILPHLSDVPLESGRFNVPVITRPDRQGWVFDTEGQWTLVPLQPRISGRIAFLTDERAVSYAETVMGIVESYKLGDIVGGPTAGTNGNINTIRLPGGLVVVFTGMVVLKQDFSVHHGVGISPTYPVTRTITGVAAGRDEVLQGACRVVGYVCD